MKKYGFCLAALFLFFASIAAAQGNGSGDPTRTEVASRPQAGANGSFQERTPRYRLRKGDTFEVDFDFSPEFNQMIAVQPDGFISLRGAATIPVEAKTISELTEAIKDAYTGILQDPVISIELKDFEKPSFVVAGQVGKPGKYESRSDLTVTAGIAIAGGFTNASKHSEVVLFRLISPDTYEARVLNVKKMMANRDLREDFHLRPDDLVFVPQNKISKIRPYIPVQNIGMYVTPAPL